MRSPLRAGQPARVVSVSLLGCPATRQSSTTLRLDFLVSIARAIRRRGWLNVDAIVFPAGFLRTDHWLAPESAADRRELLDVSEVGEVARVALSKLQKGSPGCVLVLGIDTSRHLPWGFRGDQAVATFNEAGCLSVTRKVFPVDGDTNEWGRAAYLLDRQDASGDERFVPLPNGDRAMIAVCYDAFVFSEIALGPTNKLQAMRYRTDPVDGWNTFERGEARRWVDDLARQIELWQPTVLLNPIHGFARPGADGFWQRHALASASSALHGSLCVGAAHFKSMLPESGQSPLAAHCAPTEHLQLGNLRQAHRARPQDSFEIRLRSAPRNRAIVKLFEA